MAENTQALLASLEESTRENDEDQCGVPDTQEILDSISTAVSTIDNSSTEKCIQDTENDDKIIHACNNEHQWGNKECVRDDRNDTSQSDVNVDQTSCETNIGGIDTQTIRHQEKIEQKMGKTAIDDSGGTATKDSDINNRNISQATVTQTEGCARTATEVMEATAMSALQVTDVQVESASTCDVKEGTLDCGNKEEEQIKSVESQNDKSEPVQHNDNEYMDCEESTNSQTFGFDAIPMQLTGAWQSFEETKANFLKGCKWSPDGSCVITNSDDDRLRLFNLPASFYSGQYTEMPEMSAAVTTGVGELVYDYTWYPLMNSWDPATCSFISSSRGHPVQMWDAFTGKLKCTYKAIDHLDEMTSPHSVSFSLDGKLIYCGFNKMIRLFNTDRPGRQCEDRPTNEKKMGQAGIISCIAMNPQHTDLYAAGSYSKSVGVYSENSSYKSKMVYILQGHQGGVTHLKFSPDGNMLYSGSRKDSEILCWDLRNPGDVLYSMVRHADTNQRMYFDVDRTGQFIVSGNSNGHVTVWDTSRPPTDTTSNGESSCILQPVLDFAAHCDAVNGISLHPTLPLMVTASGQRKFPVPMATGSDSDDDGMLTNDETERDNSLRLWACMKTVEY